MLTSTPVLGAGPAAITPFAGSGVRTGAGRGTFDRQPLLPLTLPGAAAAQGSHAICRPPMARPPNP